MALLRNAGFFLVANLLAVYVALEIVGHDILYADRWVPGPAPSTSQALIWGGLGVLNLALAVLVLSARPIRGIHVLLAVWVGVNGVVHVTKQFVPLLSIAANQRFGNYVGLLEGFTLFPIVLIPLFFPRRLLSPAVERGLLWTAAVLVAFFWWSRPLRKFWDLGPVVWFDIGLNLVVYVGIALGCAVYLSAYLGSPTSVSRAQARYFLGAYAVTAAAMAAMGNPLIDDVNATLLEGPITWSMAEGTRIGANALGAGMVLIGLLVHRLRGAFGRALANSWWDDALILGLVAFGLVYPLLGLVEGFVWMLVRPLLFTAGILRFQLVDIQFRERVGVFATALAAGLLVIHLTTADLLARWGVGHDAAAGLATAAALFVGGAFAWPIVKRVVAGAPTGESSLRGLDVYRATLERSLVVGTPESSDSEVLRTLRGRLGISEREHAVLELELKGAHGMNGTGPAAGAAFLGKYRVQEVLGEGGFSRTYLATDERLARPAVLKITRWDSERDAKRALREGRILARLGHPNIVTIHDLEEVGGEVILVLEYLPGGSLADRMAKGRVPLADALRLADEVLAGLAAAHAEGVVHRDLKPANVLLAAGGTAKLADFGIARGESTGTMTGFTGTFSTQGTLYYMAPEQARGGKADERSDLYSVGVILYEMLAGRPYLELAGLPEFEARLAIIEREPKLPLRGVPREANDLLARTLSKDPEERPATAAAMRKALRGVQKEARAAAPRARRRRS